MCVGHKLTSDLSVLILPPSKVKCVSERVYFGLSRHFDEWGLSARGLRSLQRFIVNVAEPGQWLKQRLGRDGFHFPGTWSLLNLPPERPDIVHCHYLHGGYFDLRVFPWLSREVPVVLTLPDAWLLSGHGTHSFDCEKWKEGCGSRRQICRNSLQHMPSSVCDLGGMHAKVFCQLRQRLVSLHAVTAT